MKVQRVRPPNTDQVRWLVLDDEFVPIQSICSYLMFLDDLGRSPNTIRSTAHHLKLFWEDLCVEDGSLQIVPRDDNPNGARAKTRNPYAIPALPEVMQLYIDYLIEDLGALEVDSLPDFVFVNLWEGEIGRPMTYEAVMSLVKRLSKRTGISFTPHMLRHTRATLWIRGKQVSLEEASRLLGHASVQTTHDTYVHLTAEDLRAALTSDRRP